MKVVSPLFYIIRLNGITAISFYTETTGASGLAWRLILMKDEDKDIIKAQQDFTTGSVVFNSIFKILGNFFDTLVIQQSDQRMSIPTILGTIIFTIYSTKKCNDCTCLNFCQQHSAVS